jgi:hypothetical protein
LESITYNKHKRNISEDIELAKISSEYFNNITKKSIQRTKISIKTLDVKGSLYKEYNNNNKYKQTTYGNNGSGFYLTDIDNNNNNTQNKRMLAKKKTIKLMKKSIQNEFQPIIKQNIKEFNKNIIEKNNKLKVRCYIPPTEKKDIMLPIENQIYYEIILNGKISRIKSDINYNNFKNVEGLINNAYLKKDNITLSI